jgi:hypothetical protein
MAQRKPKKVMDVIHSKSGVTVGIYHPPNSLKFMADLPGDDTIYDDSGEMLRKRVLEWLDQNMSIEWFPVIQVDETPPSYGENGSTAVGFDLERFYYAKKVNGEMLKREWDNSNDQRTYAWHPGKDADEFNPPLIRHNYRETITLYYPYSEKLYSRLEQLQLYLGYFKLNLRTVLESGSEPLVEALLADMVKVAPEPEQKKSKFEI